RRLALQVPVQHGAFVVDRVKAKLAVRIAPVKVRDRGLHRDAVRHVVCGRTVVGEKDLSQQDQQKKGKEAPDGNRVSVFHEPLRKSHIGRSFEDFSPSLEKAIWKATSYANYAPAETAIQAKQFAAHSVSS